MNSSNWSHPMAFFGDYFNNWPGKRFMEALSTDVYHLGVDYVAHPEVSSFGEPVFACSAGEVVFIGNDNELGNYIVVHHKDAVYGELFSLYSNLNSIKVIVGTHVVKGALIGTCGNSVVNNLGKAHLHFEVMRVFQQHPGNKKPLMKDHLDGFILCSSENFKIAVSDNVSTNVSPAVFATEDVLLEESTLVTKVVSISDKESSYAEETIKDTLKDRGLINDTEINNENETLAKENKRLQGIIDEMVPLCEDLLIKVENINKNPIKVTWFTKFKMVFADFLSSFLVVLGMLVFIYTSGVVTLNTDLLVLYSLGLAFLILAVNTIFKKLFV